MVAVFNYALSVDYLYPEMYSKVYSILFQFTETPHLVQGMEDRSVVVGETVALQCKALGSPPPRITWFRGEEPLRASERYHFTPGNQLLVIGSAALEDAGRYTCVMSNPLGTERAHCRLSVFQRPSSPCTPPPGPSTVTVGIIVIAVVTSIVMTSLVWVCIIYQTRKKSEECSVNTGKLQSIYSLHPLKSSKSLTSQLHFHFNCHFKQKT